MEELLYDPTQVSHDWMPKNVARRTRQLNVLPSVSDCSTATDMLTPRAPAAPLEERRTGERRRHYHVRDWSNQSQTGRRAWRSRASEAPVHRETRLECGVRQTGSSPRVGKSQRTQSNVEESWTCGVTGGSWTSSVSDVSHLLTETQNDSD